MSFSEQLTSYLQSVEIAYHTEQLPEGKIRPDEALLNFNKWLGENRALIAELPHPKKNENQIKTNISIMTKQFPVIWSEKEVYNHVHPHFPKEDYINYLSKLNNSYRNLPVPNYNPPFSVYNLPNFNQNWFRIEVEEFKHVIYEKQVNGKDYLGLSFENLLKVIHNFPQVNQFIVDCYNDILSGNYSLCTDWCSAHICARYKGGEKTDPKRFRPLTILPVLVRILDGILSSKLHDIVLNHSIIDTRVQKAVLKNSSGLWENVFEVNMRISEMIKDDRDKLFLFIDFNNAFGSVNYRTMLTILQRYNFAPQFSAYFERYYKNVSGIYAGEQFKWKNGLFQGSAISNILFLIYIDFAMKNAFKDLKAMQYIDAGYDLQDNSFAFVDDVVLILERNQKLPKAVSFFNKLMGYYGLTVNTDKTYFVVKDQSINEIELAGIIYKKATVDFAYLGHCLFIYEKEVMQNILEKTENCLKTIDSFNIPGKLKAYIYYSCIFLRINRTMECFYLIRGKTEIMEEIIELVSYFVYRWGIPDHLSYGKKHLEYIYSKGTTKLSKSQNLQNYHRLITDVELIGKYGVGNSIEDKNQDFNHIFETESPELEMIEQNLNVLKTNNYFPLEHFQKSGSGFYADNFVAWVE